MIRPSTPADKIALSLLKGMTGPIADGIVANFGSIGEFMHIDVNGAKIPADGLIPLMLSERRAALEQAEGEARFAASHSIRVVSVEDAEYPGYLRECADSPAVLYVLGSADLNAKRMLAMVGTRRLSAYGLSSCSRLVEGLHELVAPVTVVSGLAHGVDAACHRAALECGMPTVAVLAHGLSMIYPAQHRQLAKQIIDAGGALVTEYLHEVKPYRGHFLARNRIVAGMTAGTLVVESPVRGGALNTAAHARGYDREVMALPGRANDLASAGCNHLIRNELAVLTASAREICETLRWELPKPVDPKKRPEPSLFVNLDTYEKKKIYECLTAHEDPIAVDELVRLTGIPISTVMATIGLLEFDGMVLRHPGNRLSPA